jgi:hypothetical protein
MVVDVNVDRRDRIDEVLVAYLRYFLLLLSDDWCRIDITFRE